VKAEVEFAVLHGDPGESDGAEPPRQLIGVNRHELVSGVRAHASRTIAGLDDRAACPWHLPDANIFS